MLAKHKAIERFNAFVMTRSLRLQLTECIKPIGLRCFGSRSTEPKKPSTWAKIDSPGLTRFIGIVMPFAGPLLNPTLMNQFECFFLFLENVK